MAKTMDEIAMQYGKLRFDVADKMRELINTKGKKCEDGMRYVPTESQQKKLALFSDREVVSVGTNDKVSGGIYVEVSGGLYVEGNNTTYTAFSIIPFQIQFNILGCLTNHIK